MLGGELILTSLGRTTDVASQNNSRTLLQHIGNSFLGCLNTSIIGDIHILIKWNIIIHAAKYFLTLKIYIFNGFLIHTHINKNLRQ